MRRLAATALVVWGLGGCMPPSVRAVDAWLSGLSAGDDAAVVAWSHPADQPHVARGLADRATDPTTHAALALPPPPIEHYFVGIDHKSEDGTRHVVQTQLTLKNPLPFASRKVGQSLEGIPETRMLTKRFLSVQLPSGDWRVKLDLPAVIARAELAERFAAAITARDWNTAEGLLADVPPPPDEPDALQKTDRLAETLAAELAKARKTATATRSEPRSRIEDANAPDE